MFRMIKSSLNIHPESIILLDALAITQQNTHPNRPSRRDIVLSDSVQIVPHRGQGITLLERFSDSWNHTFLQPSVLPSADFESNVIYCSGDGHSQRQ